MSKNKHTVDILQLVAKDDKPSQRVIVLSNMQQIQKAVDLGYTRKKIFDILSKEKVIECDYSYFMRLLRKHLTPSPANKSRTEPFSSKTATVPGNSNPFSEDDGMGKAEELI